MLDRGFRSLYELRFPEARMEFLAFQKAQPGDPLGKAAEAASYLYEEFNDKKILTSAFFLDDAKMQNGADGTPAQNRNDAFLAANHQARDMARLRLKSNPNDAHSLFVLAIADGMESDYDALLVKRQIASLGLIRQAEAEATRLLALDSSAQDAYVALGASSYIIGCLPAYKRAFLWFGGIHGDRAHGMEELQTAVSRGHYLQPFAKIMLALACEREHQMDRARALLADLCNQFPANPLFARELALLEVPSGGD